MEGMSALIRRARASGRIQGISVARGAPEITHLLFADDCFLFCRANPEEVEIMKEILAEFSTASGQFINFTKSSIFFSSNLENNVKGIILDILGIPEGSTSGKYLGLPSLIGRKKREILGFIKNKVIGRISSWNNKFLSKAGREIMIKNVLQAIPTYAMSLFLLPQDICSSIEVVLNGFWWNGSQKDGKGIRWKNWSDLCRPKSAGGMGFRKVREFNLALLGKQAWRFIQNPDSFVSKVYKARYFKNSSFIHAKMGSNPSFVWRSIMESQAHIAANIGWRVGNGLSIDVWKDPWLPCKESRFIQSIGPDQLQGTKVNSLMNMQKDNWDHEILEDLFEEADRMQILKIHITSNSQEDKIIWLGEESGAYTVKSSYRLLTGVLEHDSSFHWTKVWNLAIPPKVKNFVWQACSNLLPTTDNLRIRRVNCSPICILCSVQQESIRHLILNCPFAHSCLSRIPNTLLRSDMTLAEWVSWHIKVLDEDSCCLLLIVCWKIWEARNQKLWNNIVISPNATFEDARAFLSTWRSFHQTHRKRVRQITTAKWVKPPSGWLKMNTDAAIDIQGKKVGLGLVLRDSEGSLVAAVATNWSGDYHPKIAEAISVREALKWLKDRRLNHVQIETDSLLVIQGLTNSSTVSYFDLVLEDVRVLANSFSHISFSFVKRSANMAAHVVARDAVFNADRREWLLLPPPFLSDVLISDL